MEQFSNLGNFVLTRWFLSFLNASKDWGFGCVIPDTSHEEVKHIKFCIGFLQK